ncbi:ubiquitin-conjugating enzyme E2 Z [Rhipicephalus sanguineus]|uniref:ubiquitin-conjugating enzyme E2 Z n=1 Tax=Rhipicephalus sanguineus TaxID=34632 RepID=UPI001893FEE9|nr:ubiquitin-conjugating enzyme E2 Z [Rhipicephalus sanguineus]
MYAASWYPKSIGNEAPSAACLLRIERDIEEIKADPLPGIFVSPEENDLSKLHAVVVGPSGTPYEGGFFHFFIKCPSSYPMQPPYVRLVNTDGGRVRFNPNFYAFGELCLSILDTWSGPAWSPVQTIGTVLLSIQSLLNKEPYYNHPEQTRGILFDGSKSYNEKLRHETIRVAVCDAVEACLQDSPPCPPDLVAAILRTFAESYDKYEKKVEKRLYLTGTKMSGDQLGPNLEDAVFRYETLLTRLRELKERVKKHEDEKNANLNAHANAASASNGQ